MSVQGNESKDAFSLRSVLSYPHQSIHFSLDPLAQSTVPHSSTTHSLSLSLAHTRTYTHSHTPLLQTVCTVNLVKIPNDPSDPPPHGDDGTPFNVNYKQRFAASGQIPGSVTRREGRPSDSEVLSARIVDR